MTQPSFAPYVALLPLQAGYVVLNMSKQLVSSALSLY